MNTTNSLPVLNHIDKTEIKKRNNGFFSNRMVNQTKKNNEHYNQIISFFNNQSQDLLTDDENPYNYFHKTGKKQNKVIKITQKNPLSTIEEDYLSNKNLNKVLNQTKFSLFEEYVNISKKNFTKNKSDQNFSKGLIPKNDTNLSDSSNPSQIKKENSKIKLNFQMSHSNFHGTKNHKNNNCSTEIINLISTLGNCPKDISVIKNSLEFIKETFPDVCDNFKHFILFEYNQSSEMNQVESLLNFLNLVINTINSKYHSDSVKTELFHKQILKIMDFVYHDFTKNLSIYSKKRSKFLNLIWNQQQTNFNELNEFSRIKYNTIQEKLNTLQEKYNSLGKSKLALEIKHKKTVEELEYLNIKNQQIECSLNSKEVFIDELEKLIEEKNEEIIKLNKQINVLSKIGIRKESVMKTTIIPNNNEQNKVSQELTNLINKSRKTSIKNDFPILSEKINFNFGSSQEIDLIQRNLKKSMQRNSILAESAKIFQSRLTSHKNIDSSFGIVYENIEKETCSKEVQTDLTESHFALIDPNQYLEKIFERKEEFGRRINKISTIINHKKLRKFNLEEENLMPDEFIRKNMKINTVTSKSSQAISSSDDDEVIKKSQSHTLSFLEREINSLLFDCNLIINDNDVLREKFEQERDLNENLKDSYHEALTILANNIIENNEDINSYLEKNHSIPIQLKESLSRIIDRNFVIMEKEKDSLMQIVSKEIIDNSLKKKSNLKSQITTKSTVRNLILDKLNVHKNTELINEFVRNHLNKIRSLMPLRKVLKIIDNLFFEIFDRYFKKGDKLIFDLDEPFIDPSEVPFLYFTQNFGLETLAKKKFFEFLQSCSNFYKQNKRVSIFCSLINLNFDKKEKNWGFLKKYQFIKFIQYLKFNKVFIKITTSTEDTKIFIIHHKLQEIILDVFPNLNQEMKQNINNFFDYCKCSIVKDFKSYIVVDFDDCMQFTLELLSNHEEVVQLNLSKIFSSIDLEKVNWISSNDLRYINNYIFKSKISESRIQKFESFEFDEFLNIVVSSNAFRIANLNEFLKLTNQENLTYILKILKSLSKDTDIIKILTKRLEVVQKFFNVDSLLRKTEIIEKKLTEINNFQENEINILWTSIRIFDCLTYDLYKEAVISTYFGKLNVVLNDFNNGLGIKREEDFIIDFTDNL